MAQIKHICEMNGIEEPNIFTEFGSFTVGESGAALFCRSSGEAVLSHILYITGRVPEDAAELGRFGRLTILSCGADAPEAIAFDAEHYAEQLSELEI